MDTLKIKGNTFEKIIDWGIQNFDNIIEQNSFNGNMELMFKELKLVVQATEEINLEFIISGNVFNDMKIITGTNANNKSDIIQLYSIEPTIRNGKKDFLFNFILNGVDSKNLLFAEGTHSILQSIMHLYTYILFHENVVELEKTVKLYDKHKPKKTQKKRKVYLEKQYKLKYIESEKLYSPKTRNITAESWNVRGHFRTLKSGKKVFVKPYVKGKGRKIEKEYIL